jgi:hypothetical protein
MRVLVCGGRDYSDYGAVKRELDKLARMAGMLRVVLVVIEGGARGADALAVQWCEENPGNLQHIKVRADWAEHGRRAGPIRNQRMINEENPSVVLAFPGGRGTEDMVRRAEKAGIEVRRIT